MKESDDRSPEMLDATRSSFLQGARLLDEAAWRQLVDVYSAKVYAWCRREGLQQADAADVVQNVFESVAKNLKSFHHDPPSHRFRYWLRAITLNRIHDYWRKEGRNVVGKGGTHWQTTLAELLTQSNDSDRSATSLGKNLDPRLEVLRQIQESTPAKVWGMFHRLVVDGEPADRVAEEFGVTRNTVYLAKSRLLSRLRKAATAALSNRETQPWDPEI